MPERSSDVLEGGCSCGAVRYRLNARPLFVHCCHCTNCQHQTGAAFAVNALIETGAVETLAGEVTRTVLPTPSGKGQALFRCSACGVTVWSHYLAAGDRLCFVRVGTLDDPTTAPPDIHIHTASKLPWVALPEGVPAVAEYYRPSDYWPAESIDRFKKTTQRQGSA